jgi:hypothetical protein
MLYNADLLDERVCGDTEEICSALGAALLLAQAVATSPNSKQLRAPLAAAAQSAVQLACIFTAPNIDPAAPSPAPSLMSTPGAGSACPEASRLLEATVAHAGHSAAQAQPDDSDDGAAANALPPAAVWLRDAVKSLEESVCAS